MKFFNSVFSLFPNHQFHGLGLTDVRIIKSFPFYSADSTTWLMAEKVGKVFDPNGKRCNPIENSTSKEKFENTISYFTKLEK